MMTSAVASSAAKPLQDSRQTSTKQQQQKHYHSCSSSGATAGDEYAAVCYCRSVMLRAMHELHARNSRTDLTLSCESCIGTFWLPIT
jgi:hypothetical protein